MSFPKGTTFKRYPRENLLKQIVKIEIEIAKMLTSAKTLKATLTKTVK